jgi:hypothetical protein
MDSKLELLNSFRINLLKRDFRAAREKINENLDIINSNIIKLQNYLYKLGSKNEDKKLIKKA